MKAKLTERMVVISIIVILVAIVLPQFFAVEDQQENTIDAAVNVDERLPVPEGLVSESDVEVRKGIMEVYSQYTDNERWDPNNFEEIDRALAVYGAKVLRFTDRSISE